MFFICALGFRHDHAETAYDKVNYVVAFFSEHNLTLSDDGTATAKEFMANEKMRVKTHTHEHTLNFYTTLKGKNQPLFLLLSHFVFVGNDYEFCIE